MGPRIPTTIAHPERKRRKEVTSKTSGLYSWLCRTGRFFRPVVYVARQNQQDGHYGHRQKNSRNASQFFPRQQSKDDQSRVNAGPAAHQVWVQDVILHEAINYEERRDDQQVAESIDGRDEQRHDRGSQRTDQGNKFQDRRDGCKQSTVRGSDRRQESAVGQQGGER